MILFENLLAGYSLTHCLLIDNSQYGPDSGLLGITMNLLPHRLSVMFVTNFIVISVSNLLRFKKLLQLLFTIIILQYHANS